MDEIWKDVVGFEGRYMVSNFGNVKSLRYRGHNEEKIMRTVRHHSGYSIITLGKKPRKNYSVHILVAEAFVDNPCKKPYINHIDGNKSNNRADNLEWVTAKENTQHAIRTGLRDPYNIPRRYGEDHYASKPVYQFDIYGNFIKKWGGQSEAARAMGCKSCTIWSRVDNPGMTAKGYVWLSSPDKFDEWKTKYNRFVAKRYRESGMEVSP